MLKTMTDKELKEVRHKIVLRTTSLSTSFSGSIFFQEEDKSWERCCLVTVLKKGHVNEACIGCMNSVLTRYNISLESKGLRPHQCKGMFFTSTYFCLSTLLFECSFKSLELFLFHNQTGRNKVILLNVVFSFPFFVVGYTRAWSS